MKRKQYTLVLVALMLITTTSNAQKEKLIGLWEIKNVVVGNQNMTPVAKWTQINSDGTYASGNGWLQNAKGKWNFDTKTNIYSAVDVLDVADEFGGFSVTFENNKMCWSRVEEGQNVKVTLSKIKELPMSPADYLEGIWDLEDIKKKGKSITKTYDKNNKHKLFIRWDRIYLNFNPEGKKTTGYWHIHGHKPHITLIPHSKDDKLESWKVSVNEKELIMIGLSDTNRDEERIYKRRNSF
ncbi:hypothetical protein [uncultured Tenacibaculum sp.]|uniref:hypothetical protein n=1 Tax=uncultured Tenacibaculum sp. TaxID=174713 RepID=UPI0026130DFC|nr:hypothetical protein [uncultured Tenacibaculum sp.]